MLAVRSEIEVVRILDDDCPTRKSGPGIDRGQAVPEIVVDPQRSQVERRYDVLRFVADPERPSTLNVRGSISDTVSLLLLGT